MLDGRQLMGDALPPALFLIEANAAARELARDVDQSRRASLRAALAKTREEFEERHAYWTSPAAADKPALDEGQLRGMEDLFKASSGGFYADMLQPYLSHTQGRLQDLERALAQADTRSVALIAHTIKGSSLNMGFVGMGSRAGALEMEARQGKVKDPESLSGALKDELSRVALFAERYRKEAARS